MTASLEAEGPNAEQIVYWSETTGPRWVARQEQLDAQIAPLGLAAMEHAEIAPGARVLDVGCGCGQTLLQLAERVGAAGKVLGVDVSEPMLARAAERVAEAGLAQVRTLRADAQTHAFEPGAFDRVFSRFGVMFFADPRAAFANLRRALVPGGLLTFVCWQPLGENPWLAAPMRAIAERVALPPPPAPDAPGPFSFSDAARVRDILEDAGFAEVGHTSLDRELRIGGAGLDAAAELCLELGPAAAALRLAVERGERVDRAALLEALRAALAPFLRDGGVWMRSASWIVRARA